MTMRLHLYPTALVLLALGAANSAHAENAILHSVHRLAGTMQGAIADLRQADGRALSIRSTSLTPMSFMVICGAHVSASSVNRIDVRVRARRTVSGPVRISLLDWQTNTWRSIGNLTFGASYSNQGLAVLSGARRFFAPGGSIRVRFDSIGPATLQTDHLQVMVQ